MEEQKWENNLIYSITHKDNMIRDLKGTLKSKKIMYYKTSDTQEKDLNDFHELNQFMTRNRLNYLPDEMIDDSIHCLLRKQLRRLLLKDD